MWLEMLILCLTLCEYFLFYFVVFGDKVVISKKFTCGIASVLVMLFSHIFAYVKQKVGFAGVIFPFTMIVLYPLINNVGFKKSIKNFLITFPIISILEVLLELIVKELIIRDSIVEIIVIGLTIVLILLYYFFIGKKIDKNLFVIKGKVYFFLVSMLYILVIMITFFLYIINRTVHTRIKIVGKIVMVAGGITIIVLAMTTIYLINMHVQNKLTSALAYEHNLQQRKYFELLLERENKTKAFRHDIIDELLILKNYIENENYKNATLFVDSMLKDISFINRYEYVVGNRTIDILLNYYLIPIKEECNITVNGNVKDELKIEDKDLCIVVANVLKNSVEAVKHIKSEGKYINIDVRNGRDFFSINVSNPFVENKKSRFDDRQDGIHGFGLQNIKGIVKKYNGVYKVEKDNNVFNIKISLQIA